MRRKRKVRLVFDCAAVKEKKSLNDALLSGPDLTAPLVNVLQRFREGPVAVSGDLKDMFHRVYVQEKDRWAQRFLWRWDIHTEPLVFEMCVLTFGATCSPSLAQYVKNRNADRFASDHPTAVEAIKTQEYVDDFLGCGETEEQLLQIAMEVKRIHETAGFKMHKWTSNSKAVLLGLDQESHGTEVSLSTSGILGMLWNTDDDSLSFWFRCDEFGAALNDESFLPTKRIMLSIVMSIYDPLGLVSFLTIEGKLVLRESWREDADWDDKLGGGIQRRWVQWAKGLDQLKEVVIPRWHGTTKEEVELHVFVDASDSATACACYVVQRQPGGAVVRSLVMAKCLVAPLKAKSIPRLELDAALLGVRVARIVTKHTRGGSNGRYFGQTQRTYCGG